MLPHQYFFSFFQQVYPRNLKLKNNSCCPHIRDTEHSAHFSVDQSTSYTFGIMFNLQIKLYTNIQTPFIIPRPKMSAYNCLCSKGKKKINNLLNYPYAINVANGTT